MPRPCRRDKRGWLLPASGTMSRTVYDVLVAAQQSGEEFRYTDLAELLGTTTKTVYFLASRIRAGSWKKSPRNPPSARNMSSRRAS